MIVCTWVGCRMVAVKDQFDRGGRVWAHLCIEHDQVLSAALKSGDAKKILSSWVKASGGAKKLTESM